MRSKENIIRYCHTQTSFQASIIEILLDIRDILVEIGKNQKPYEKRKTKNNSIE